MGGVVTGRFAGGTSAHCNHDIAIRPALTAAVSACQAVNNGAASGAIICSTISVEKCAAIADSMPFFQYKNQKGCPAHRSAAPPRQQSPVLLR